MLKNKTLRSVLGLLAALAISVPFWPVMIVYLILKYAALGALWIVDVIDYAMNNAPFNRFYERKCDAIEEWVQAK
jgi:hypothetical protein